MTEPADAASASHHHRRRRRRHRRRRRAADRWLWLVGVVTLAAVAVGAVAVVVHSTSSDRPGGALADQTTSTSAAPTLSPSVARAAPGVTARSIRVVFPVVDPSSPAGRLLAASDPEFDQQAAAIQTFVAAVNARGGVNGRRLDPQILAYDPGDAASRAAVCRAATTGATASFAVVDGSGLWTGSDQQCVARRGRTPMIGQWAGITSQTDAAAPFLWWTGVDGSIAVRTVIEWAAVMTPDATQRRIGVVTTTQADDRDVLLHTVEPTLDQVGAPAPLVVHVNGPGEAAVAVRQLRSAGIGTVLPVLSTDGLRTYLQAATAGGYFPTILLSDYKGLVTDALGLAGAGFARALDGQAGVTTLTLGDLGDDRAPSQHGYNRSARICDAVWKAADPTYSAHDGYLEAHGPLQGWCQAIGLFAQAATGAGRALDRGTFVHAMAEVHRFAGTNTPLLTYGPDNHSGPVVFRVVTIQTDGTQCPPSITKVRPPSCWAVRSDWNALDAFAAAAGGS